MSYKLPLKDIVSFWDAGVKAYSNGDYVKATSDFQRIAEDGTARISYNLGCIAKKVGALDVALEHFKNAIIKDKHLVAAYVQMGSIYDHFDMFEAAVQSYRFAAHHIYSCKYINYHLLGLKLTVYLTQVLYNQACVEARVNNWEQAETLILKGVQAQEDGHFKQLLDTALDCIARKENFTPVRFNDELFHPSKLMVENLANVNYLGESEIILNTENEKKALYVSRPNPIHQFLQDSEEWYWPSPPTRSSILSSCSTSSSSSSSSSPSSSINLRIPPPPSRPIPEAPAPALKSRRSPIPPKKMNNTKSSCNTRNSDSPKQPPPPPIPPQRDIRTKNVFKVFEALENSKSEVEQRNKKTASKTIPEPDFSCGECHVTAMFSLLTSNPDILSFDKGDRIKVQKRAENGWFHGSLSGKSGLVPWNCMKH